MSNDKFSISPDTRAQLLAALEGIADPKRQEIIDAMASLVAESQLVARQSAIEDFRHAWSQTFTTLMR